MQNVRPMPARRSRRFDIWRGITSGRAGQVLPVAFFPLLREDRVSGKVAVQLRMEETLRPVRNAINVRLQAWLVPHVALERFNGSMETFNRSYAGELMPDGAAAPALFTDAVKTAAAVPVLTKLGIHVREGDKFNMDLIRSYNVLCNHRRQLATEELGPVPEDRLQLHRAFWLDRALDYVKPSFDQLLMQGGVEAALVGRAPVSGAGVPNAGYTWQPVTAGGIRTTEGTDTVAGNWSPHGADPQAGGSVRIKENPDNPGFPGVFAELANSTAYFTLADIQLAQQTQSFAKVRDAFKGRVSDDYLIDLLMAGIEIPPEDLRNPHLVGEARGVVGIQERYATDGASLDMSRSNGFLSLSCSISTPKVNTGGVVIVILEIVPESLFERREDPYIALTANSHELPQYDRDFLDPEKVVVMQNREVDVLHDAPSGLFGYAPLNHEWNRSFTRMGGRFIRRNSDQFVEDRQILWSCDIRNPALGEDFFLCPSDLPHSVFADTAADPFEITVLGRAAVDGLTVFGAPIEEDTNSYEEQMAVVDRDLITQGGFMLVDYDDTGNDGGSSGSSGSGAADGAGSGSDAPGDAPEKGKGK